MNYLLYFYKLFNNEEQKNADLKNIVYIHGAQATHRSFKYIQKNLPEHNKLNFEYSIKTPYEKNLNNLRREVKEVFGDKKISLIGHSLGGLFAVEFLQEYEFAEKAFTMSAPFGGSKLLKYIKWLCPSSFRMFQDLSLTSSVIMRIKDLHVTKPVMQIVTLGGGNPVFGEPNDGTVTVTSQKSLKNIVYKEYNLVHGEVLLSEDIINEIKEFIFSN